MQTLQHFETGQNSACLHRRPQRRGPCSGRHAEGKRAFAIPILSLPFLQCLAVALFGPHGVRRAQQVAQIHQAGGAAAGTGAGLVGYRKSNRASVCAGGRVLACPTLTLWRRATPYLRVQGPTRVRFHGASA